MRPLVCLFLVCLFLAWPLLAADNTLHPDEKRQGWILLFDGHSMRGWQDPSAKTPPGDAWLVQDGCLKTRLKPRITEDLLTAESFGDFELLFDWRVAERGNTGVKYRIQDAIFVDDSKVEKGPGGFEGIMGRELARRASDRAKLPPGGTGFVYTVGFEFQLLDDQRHPDARKDARHTTGALYSMIAPRRTAARPAGQWNQSRLLVRADHFQHWINGVLVLDGSLSSPEVKAAAARRWAPAPPIRDMLIHPKPSGPIALQHHGDEVWFRNLKIRRLP